MPECDDFDDGGRERRGAPAGVRAMTEKLRRETTIERTDRTDIRVYIGFTDREIGTRDEGLSE